MLLFLLSAPVHAESTCDGRDNDFDGRIDENATCSVSGASCRQSNLNGNSYLVCDRNDGAISHAEARQACVMKGYHLVDPDQDGEHAFIVDGLTHWVSYWMGINDVVSEGVYRRSDGSVPEDLLWDVGFHPNPQPDGDGDDCATFYPTSTAPFLWHDAPCDADWMWGFVCEADCDLRSYWDDDDGDGFGAGPAYSTCGSIPGHTADQPGDCDDGDATIHPDALELCDSADRNCDGDPIVGAVDKIGFHADLDDDGFGDPDNRVFACFQPDGTVLDDDDCDDDDPLRHPDAAEICNDGIDNDCDGAQPVVLTRYADADGDGFGGASFLTCDPAAGVTHSTDCNDQAGSVNPDAAEVCDQVDNDCDQWIDEAGETVFTDADGDGWGTGTGFPGCPNETVASQGGDCDDEQSSVNPGASELCDEVDNDCDGAIDDEVVSVPWFLDSDGDGVGAGPAMLACESPGQGYVQADGDCDDNDPTLFPGAVDLCDGADNNCDGRIDEDGQFDGYADLDGDGWGGEPLTGCLGTEVVGTSGDCDDADPDVSPEATETCNGIDDDCNDAIDEHGEARSWYQDADGDGIGGAAIEQCTPPDGYVAHGGDCDDQDPNIGGAAPWYQDLDSDGWGGAPTASTCTPEAGWVARGGDCDDLEPAVNPGSPEHCVDALDNDCDGLVDEQDPDFTGFLAWFDADGDGYGAADPTCFTDTDEPPAGWSLDGSDCDDTNPSTWLDCGPWSPTDGTGFALSCQTGSGTPVWMAPWVWLVLRRRISGSPAGAARR